MISTLIAVPSPRDIQITQDSLNTIKGVPRLHVKYHSESEAYSIIEDYFLQHPEYQYCIICPDDLVVTQKDYDELVKTIYDNGGPEKIPTISGICNIQNIPGYGTQLALCIEHVVHPQRRRRHYVWSDLRNPIWYKKGYDKMSLLQVKFSGFAFQFIRRDIVEKIGLQGDLRYNEFHRQAQDYSFDVVFCWLCNENQIPIYVNPQVKLLHLRGSNNREVPGIEPLLVGKKDRVVLFVDEEGKEHDITEKVHKELQKKKEAKEKQEQGMEGALLLEQQHQQQLSQGQKKLLAI